MTNLFDKRAALQIIGCILLDQTILDRFEIEEDDIPEEFHYIVFSAIYNLYNQNIEVIDSFSIDSFLSNYEKQYRIFTDNDGIRYIETAKRLAEPANFEHNYRKLKKLSLLRYYLNQNIDIRPIYDYTKEAPEEQAKETEKLDAYSVDDIIDQMELNIVTKPRLKFSSSLQGQGQLAGQGMSNLIDKWKEEPEIGIPTQSPILNTIVRGARIKKFYLRSAPSGTGKSRLAVGDICSYSIPWYYSLDSNSWIFTGFSEPSLFITTELEIEEVQSMILAFVSGVPEDHILDGVYQHGEEERVRQAAQYIESSPLYIEYMEDFDIQDIENLIKKYKKEKDVLYVSFDYIHTSVKLIMEIANMSKGMKMQEYQVLYIFAIKLKELCNKLGVHIDSSTQLNGEYKNAKDKDETLLRGAKSVADKIDVGIIAMRPTREELKAIEPIMKEGVRLTPNMIYHIYKVRRGKISKVRLWLHADLGVCRTYDLFVTNNDNKLIPVESLTIENIEKVLEDNSIDKEDVHLPEEEHEEAMQFIF